MNKRATTPTDSMDAATTARLCEALEPVAPGASAFKRMRERILYSISDTPIQAVRPNDRQWQILLPGVAVKILRADMIERTQTALWKLDAGARIPAHAHVLEEECMILQGELEHAGTRYSTGDFLFTRGGAQHEDIHTPRGALLLIRGERIGTAGLG